jgi:sialic acid synthase SpsE
MIAAIREVGVLLGSAVKAPTESELAVRAVARRSVTAMRDLKAGAVIDVEDVDLLRPAGGILPRDLDDVIGRRTRQDVGAGTPLTWEHLE